MLKPWLRIVRLPLAATPVCDVVACTLLGWMSAGLVVRASDLASWGLLAATSVLIYFAGMAANDLADMEVDRLKDPSRPLPSGDLKPLAVGVLVALCAGGAIAIGGGPFGSRWAVLAAVACAFVYDFVVKNAYLPGVLAMGGVRAANASIALWPLVLSGAAAWYVLLAPLAIGLYAAGVTALSTTEDEDHPERLWTARVLAATAFIIAAALAWLVGGFPTLGIGVAFGITTSTLFGRTPKPGPRKRMVLEMLLGLFWLAAVIAGGWNDGTIQGSVIVGFAALVVAWALAVGSQLLIRALRKPA